MTEEGSFSKDNPPPGYTRIPVIRGEIDLAPSAQTEEYEEEVGRSSGAEGNVRSVLVVDPREYAPMEVNDSELLSISSNLEKADVRIGEQQAVISQLKNDTRQSLAALAEVLKKL